MSFCFDREKKEEAERKKLGIEKEDEQEDEDDLIGGPWKRLDADEIKKKVCLYTPLVKVFRIIPEFLPSPILSWRLIMK